VKTLTTTELAGEDTEPRDGVVLPAEEITTKSQIAFRQAGTKAQQNYKKLIVIPSAPLLPNPMLCAALL